MASVLVVDDEAIIRKDFCSFMSSNGFDTYEASGGKSALEQFSRLNPMLVLLDLNMPDMGGMDVLKELKNRDPDIPVIIITAYGDIPSAVDAIKQGAYDFLTKPVDFEKLLIIVSRAVEKVMLKKRVDELNTSLHLSLESIFGRSRPIKAVIDSLCQIAATDFSVVILGETGTGKTFLANTIHNLSKRAEKPFVKVSIGSIPDTLIESELFGHEKGAFTGAERTKNGYFEAADKGTIFIDDMDNIPTHVQGKLLSALEDKKIFRIGSTVPIDLDFRIICATNTDLLEAATEGRFRQDLYYRLSELVIHLPPLRERKDDIVFFVEKFAGDTCLELNRPECEIHESAMKTLLDYSWPGNLRQLKNVIRRSVLLTADAVIKPEDISFLMEHINDPVRQHGFFDTNEGPVLSIKEAEKIAIKRALHNTGGQKLKAASILQITYKTLVKKMQEYNIS
ncbi:MAG: sigma-54 dependent transcriptional regulator [Dissulfurispiraceae bacterium]